MKKLTFLLSVLLCTQISLSQTMNTNKLSEIIHAVSDSVITNGNPELKFIFKQTPFICVADDANNRMRIMSPITTSSDLTDELKTTLLNANFDAALDVKYAIANNMVWSVYMHPLKELNEEQVLNAITQVYFSNTSFGHTFSSEPAEFSEKKIIREEIIPQKHNLIAKM